MYYLTAKQHAKAAALAQKAQVAANTAAITAAAQVACNAAITAAQNAQAAAQQALTASVQTNLFCASNVTTATTAANTATAVATKAASKATKAASKATKAANNASIAATKATTQANAIADARKYIVICATAQTKQMLQNIPHLYNSLNNCYIAVRDNFTEADLIMLQLAGEINFEAANGHALVPYSVLLTYTALNSGNAFN